MIKAAPLLLLAVSSATLAQTPPAKPPAFEVVSIRPSQPGNNGAAFRIGPDGITMTNVPFIVVLSMAFPPEVAATKSFKNTPRWVTEDHYDLIAKVGPEDLDTWQKANQTRFKKPLLEAMLQAALIDRCKLAFRRIPAEAPALALVVDKRGSTLKLADPAAPAPGKGMKLAGGGYAAFTGKDNSQIEWSFTNATSDDLSNFLESNGDVIRNQTSLTGRYDFVLAQQPFGPPDPNGLPAPPRPANLWDVKPLGLRLDPIKITVSTVVIDHIERPTDN